MNGWGRLFALNLEQARMAEKMPCEQIYTIAPKRMNNLMQKSKSA